MHSVILVCGLLLAPPALAQAVPKIDPQSCLAVMRKLDSVGLDGISKQENDFTRICIAAYSCPKSKKMMMDWDYAKDGDAPWDGGDEKRLRWQMQVCGE